MLGAIAGDIIGSLYEEHPIKTRDFPLFQERASFTDDTVLTVAVADAILKGGSYQESIRTLCRRYPAAGYGGLFIDWLYSKTPAPYGSWGNGAATRVSPVGFAFEREEDVLKQAAESASVTHNHPQAIEAAQATALAIFLARTSRDRQVLRSEIEGRFGYDLGQSVDDLRAGYSFDVSARGTVPAALVAFLDSSSWEDAVRNAVSLGGDSDTLACITGGIAEAFYGGVPPEVKAGVRQRLPADLLHITEAFCRHHCPDGGELSR